MNTTTSDFSLRLVSPEFGSPLTAVILDLERLRTLHLSGDTPPAIFFQIKSLFHLLESIGSARIEGNHTTIAEYVETKILAPQHPAESIEEIQNIEKALEYIEEKIKSDSLITHQFIKEIHHITVTGLIREGDKTPGGYRQHPVSISGSKHRPPEHILVQPYMDELLNFINRPDGPQYDLMKIAIAHHRFAWIHPFGNGNGRVVRLLTYALLIKYGFKVMAGGRVLNPTAVFCNGRDRYYDMLSKADSGEEEGLLAWTQYVLNGIGEELKKVDQLTNFDFLKQKILFPALAESKERKIITQDEYAILKISIEKGSLRAGNLDEKMPELSQRQRSYLIKKLVDNKMLQRERSSYIYTINFTKNYLLRAIMKQLSDQGFAPPLDM